MVVLASERYYSWERRRPFFDAIAQGASFVRAVAVVGAAASSCQKWWGQSSGMRLVMSAVGGLGSVPDGDGFVGDKLTALERDLIATGRAAGLSQAQIARQIGRSPSTVSRELRRNAGPDGSYYGSLAHVKAFQRSRRPKGFKLDGRDDLIEPITGWLDDGWSPRLIATVLAADSGGDQTARVSHETISRSTCRPVGICGRTCTGACRRGGRTAAPGPRPAGGPARTPRR